MARPKKHAEAVSPAVEQKPVAVDEIKVAPAYTGDKEPTKLDASDLNYTHEGSPAHLAWLKFKGL